jgi:hypothetical protein
VVAVTVRAARVAGLDRRGDLDQAGELLGRAVRVAQHGVDVHDTRSTLAATSATGSPAPVPARPS